MDIQEIMDVAKKIFLDKKEIQFAYLYGSFLKSNSYNDIDIGIYLIDDYKPDIFYEIEIMREFERYFKADFDIRTLNGRSLRFLYNMLKNSIHIFSRNEKLRIRFESNVIRQYLDIKPYYDYYNKVRELRYGIR
jgi:hypothetical protein